MIHKFNTKTCCNKTLITWKVDFKITIDLIKHLKSTFKEHEHFTKSGMLYMDNSNLIISSQLGSNSIQIRCKIKNCEGSMNDLESTLSSYERHCLQNNK